MSKPLDHSDILIVGAGILGLAHAYIAARAGLSVTVIERGETAQGASIRNFGMLAIIAQAEGAQKQSALRSLETWQHIAPQAGFDLKHSGCLILAQEPEELAVLNEFVTSDAGPVRDATLLASGKLMQQYPCLRNDSLLGGLWCSAAWKVDQRRAIANMADWLQRKHGVSFHFATEAYSAEPGIVETASGQFRNSKTIVCGGSELSSLFPDEFRVSGVSVCELQMTRYCPQPSNWQLEPFLLGGLSLARYDAFADCDSLNNLKEMQQTKYADCLNHGIHIVACQESDGSLTVGDSHTIDSDKSTGRSNQIDKLIQQQLHRMLLLPESTVEQRWLGHYAHLPGTDVLRFSPAENIQCVTMTNGQGMTHGFTVAENTVAEFVLE